YGLFARTARASRLNQFLNSVADAGLELLRRGAARWDNRSLVELCHELLSSGGEARGTALARAIIERYLALGVEEREAFLRQLAQTFGIVPERVVEAAELYVEDQTLDNLLELAAAVESPNQELFRRINTAPQGTSSIVAMRRDLLHMKSSDQSLQALDSDLHHLLHSWFNRGFLTLRRIDWNTPAASLEQLIEYDSVHAIAGWEDLRRRLASDRRCFAFFHPALPDEPLIFVEVALLNELPGSIQPLLDLNSQRELTSPPCLAVFYSINNCHEGLRGVSFGNFLIKQVVLELKEEFETLNTFATLSPVPLFGSWLKNNVDTLPAPLIDEAERPQITNMTNGLGQMEAIAGLRSA